MKTRTRFGSSGVSRRGAFTLIELLVVVTIIAALAALSASAVLKFIEVQQNNNTQSTLDRTQSKLGLAWSKVKDQAYKETIPPTTAQWIQTNLAGNDANAVGRVRVIYVKLRLRQAFPMNFNEALNPTPLSPLPAYVTYLNNLSINGSTGATYESSACLLMALSRGVSGAGINPEELTKGGATGSDLTPSGGNLPYLTDAWGRPIFFARFPTGCPVLNPNGSQAGANDPGDPQGYLQTPQWGTTYGSLFSTYTLQQLAPGNSSYKLAPMVASGGAANWSKSGVLSFNPTTFQPGNYVVATGTFTAALGTTVMYSTNP